VEAPDSPKQFVSPPAAFDEMLDADDDPDEPHRFRLVSDVLGKGAKHPGHAY